MQCESLGSRELSGHCCSDTYPSFSNSPLQSTTDPPVPILSRVCKLTKKKRTSCIKIQWYFIQL